MKPFFAAIFKNTPLTGRKIVFDYSKIRKKGSKLKTGGGKAPGYTGLKKCHGEIKKILDHVIEKEGQNRLKSINAYDVLMHLADAVLSGGIRRAATAVIFDPEDDDMINAKTFFTVKKIHHHSIDKDENIGQACVTIEENGRRYTFEYNLNNDFEKYQYEDFLLKQNKISWSKVEPQRARSNNSVRLLRGKFTPKDFKEIIKRTQQYGEPGFVFANHADQLYNPCFEVGFIPVTKDGRCGYQFCNLSSINGAKVDDKEKWKNAVEWATIIGTLQASYTNFPFLTQASTELTEAEALLGVSITGFMDNPDILLDPKLQQEMAEYCIEVNKEWAKLIGIKQAARTTLVKPEGTSSLVLGSASGIHPHHAKKYFRRIQCNKIDNVYQFFKKFNPHACEESVWSANNTDDVVTFPLEFDDNVMTKKDLTALKHLEIIKDTQINWVNTGTTKANKKPINHNVSCTVVVDFLEWDDVINYVYKNQEFYTAISFLPKTGDKDYQQAPLEEVVNNKGRKEI